MNKSFNFAKSEVNDIESLFKEHKMPSYINFMTKEEKAMALAEKDEKTQILFCPSYLNEQRFYVPLVGRLNDPQVIYETYKEYDLHRNYEKCKQGSFYKGISRIISVGNLESGMRCLLVISGFDIYFDVGYMTYIENQKIDPVLITNAKQRFETTMHQIVKDIVIGRKKNSEYKDSDIDRATPYFEYLDTDMKSPAAPYTWIKMVRIYNVTFSDRKNFIRRFAERGSKELRTYQDDTNYVDVIARNYDLKLSTFWTINKCTRKYYNLDKPEFAYNGGAPFMVVFADINEIKTCANLERTTLRNPNKGILSFDIEVGVKNPNNRLQDFPKPGYDLAEIKSICFGFCKNDSADIYPVIDNMPSFDRDGVKKYKAFKPKGYSMICKLTLNREIAIDDRYTILCRNEKEMIEAFLCMIANLRPLIIYEFNGQSYDWMWIYYRALEYKILDKIKYAMSYLNLDIDEWNADQMFKGIDNLTRQDLSFGGIFGGDAQKAQEAVPHPCPAHKWLKYNVIKTTAETRDYRLTPTYPGPLCVDVMNVMKRLYMNPINSSLTAFLGREKLGLKMDMPYDLMAMIYELDYRYKHEVLGSHNYYNLPLEIFQRLTPCGSTNLAVMNADITEYCAIDAIRCIDLMTKSGAYMGKLALSNDTPCTLYHSFYKADGGKVLAKTYSVYNKLGYAYTARRQDDVEKGTFEGAKVLQPLIGVKVPELNIMDKLYLNLIKDLEVDQDILYPVFQLVLYKKRVELSTLDKFINLIAKGGLQYGHAYKALEAELDQLPVELQKYIRDNKRKPLFQWDYKEFVKYSTFRKLTDEEKKKLSELGVKFVAKATRVLPIWVNFPATGMDFASLYPSIMMCYNLSPECIIDAKKDVINRVCAISKGIKLNEFKYLTPSGKVNHSFTPDHTFKSSTKAELKHVTECNFGIYPVILKQLFDQRKEEKKVGAKASEKLEQITVEKHNLEERIKILEDIYNRVSVNAKAGLDAKQAEAVFIDLQKLFGEFKEAEKDLIALMDKIKRNAGDQLKKLENDIDYQNYIVTKTKANITSLKVFMNTFYGKTGDSNSPQYNIYLASNVTERGRNAITIAHKFITEEKGLIPYYGDTDSLYVPTLNMKTADTILRLYYIDGILERDTFYKLLVICTMEAGNIVRDEVNAHIASIVGKDFLNMAYEEVLLPFVLFGKKKYCGIKHENVYEPDFTKIFERGLDYKKKGNNKLKEWITSLFLKTLFNVYNTFDLDVVAFNIIDHIHKIFDSIPKRCLVNTLDYRPTNNNNIKKSKSGVSIGNKNVLTFLERKRQEFSMIADPIERANLISKLPKLGERFGYYRVKRDFVKRVGAIGGSKKLDSQEYLEFDWYVNMHPEKYTLDLAAYIKHDCCKALSSYIAGHPKYMQMLKDRCSGEHGDEKINEILKWATTSDIKDKDTEMKVNTAGKDLFKKLKDLAEDDLIEYFEKKYVEETYNNLGVRTKVTMKLKKVVKESFNGWGSKGFWQFLNLASKIVADYKSNNELAFEIAGRKDYTRNMRLDKIRAIINNKVELKLPDINVIDSPLYDMLNNYAHELERLCVEIEQKTGLDKIMYDQNTKHDLKEIEINLNNINLGVIQNLIKIIAKKLAGK